MKKERSINLTYKGQCEYLMDTRLSSGKRLRKLFVAGTKGEALAAAQAIRDGAEKAISVASVAAGGPTLQQAFDRGMKLREQWRTGNRTTLAGTFKAITQGDPWSPDSSIYEVTEQAVEDWLVAQRDAGLGASTINARLSMLSVLLSLSRRMDGGDKVVVFKMPRQATPEGRTRRLTTEEEGRFIGWFSRKDEESVRTRNYGLMADLVAVLVDTGMRLQEALDLGKKGRTPFDLTTRMILVKVAKAKNPSPIPMTPRVHEVLARRGAVPFAGLTKDRADKLFTAAKEALGYGTDAELVIHTLRHTTASRLVAAGEDSLRVMRYMRHKNIRTTQKYVHLDATDLVGAASKLEQFMPNGSIQKTVQKASQNAQRMPHVGGSPCKSLIPLRPNDGERYDHALLIRRSLVRAQVGEPRNKKARSDAGLFHFRRHPGGLRTERSGSTCSGDVFQVSSHCPPAGARRLIANIRRSAGGCRCSISTCPHGNWWPVPRPSICACWP